MERCLRIVCLLLLTTALTGAWKVTFCQEGRFTCRKRTFSCPPHSVIRTESVLYLPGELCLAKAHPSVNHFKWNICCCDIHINNTLYDNNDYKRPLITHCDNKTSCNVYRHLPLKEQYGQVTIYYNCIGRNETPPVRPTQTTEDPDRHRTTQPTRTHDDKVSTTHTTLLTTKETVSPFTPGEDDSSPVPIIVACTIILLLIIGIVITVTLFRLRKGRMLKISREGMALRPREESSPPLGMEEYYSEIDPHGSELTNYRKSCAYASCSDVGKSPQLVDEDGYTEVSTSGTSSKTKSVQSRAQGEDGYYDRVDWVGKKNMTRRDVLYDHVDHQHNQFDNGSYDRVGHQVEQSGTGPYDRVGHQTGQSGTGPYDRVGHQVGQSGTESYDCVRDLKANTVEEESGYDTCVRREACTSASNTREGGRGDITGDISEHDHGT